MYLAKVYTSTVTSERIQIDESERSRGFICSSYDYI